MTTRCLWLAAEAQRRGVLSSVPVARRWSQCIRPFIPCCTRTPTKFPQTCISANPLAKRQDIHAVSYGTHLHFEQRASFHAFPARAHIVPLRRLTAGRARDSLGWSRKLLACIQRLHSAAGSWGTESNCTRVRNCNNQLHARGTSSQEEEGGRDRFAKSP